MINLFLKKQHISFAGTRPTTICFLKYVDGKSAKLLIRRTANVFVICFLVNSYRYGKARFFSGNNNENLSIQDFGFLKTTFRNIRVKALPFCSDEKPQSRNGVEKGVHVRAVKVTLGDQFI